MKKIGIAVFALMFMGVAYVGAEDIKVDFDGEIAVQDIQKTESFAMPEVFSNIEYNIPVPKREVKYENAKSDVQLSYKGVTDEMLNYSIKTAIAYAELIKEEGLKKNLGTLLKKGSIKQKYEFTHCKNKVYKFPKKIDLFLIPNKGTAEKVCKFITVPACKWITDFFGIPVKECNDVIVESCKYV